MNLPERHLGSSPALVGGASPVIGGAIDTELDRIDLAAIMAIFRRRFWLVARVVCLSLALALLITWNMPTQYRATADVELRTLPPSSTSAQTSGQTVDDPGGVRIDAVDTEIQVIKSREMAAKVFDRLALAADRDFMKEVLSKSGPKAAVMRMLLMDPGLKKGADDPRERREMAIDYMVGIIDSTRIVTTAYAMHINFSDVDPQRAARIANGYAQAYASDQSESKQDDNAKAVASLKARVQQLADQAKADFAAEQQYRIDHNLLSSNGTALTEQEVSTYNQQVAVARSEAARDRAAYDSARRQLAGGTGAAGEAQASPTVAALRAQRATISTHLAELSSKFLDGHPDVMAARQQLHDIDAQIDAEVRRTLAMLDAKARASEGQLGSLESSLGSANGTLSRNNGALIQLDGLHRRAQASQETYDSYLARYKSAVANEGADRPDSRIISIARPPNWPSSPLWLLNLALGGLLGLMLGATAAVVTETNFPGLTSGRDVEHRLGAPYLGSLPLLRSIKPHSASPQDTLLDYPGGGFAEAVRGVLASARQSTNSRNQVLAVTSALPDEGKTTLASCLARVAGLAGERVVLVDCDPVRASLSKLLPSTDKGLREILEEGFDSASVLPVVEADRVAYIAIAEAFAKGERLNEKGKFHRLIAKLRERYDLVVLDLPPVLPIAETRELAAIADNVVMVAKWRKTRDTAIRAALRMLPLAKISFLGVALNAVDMRKRMQIDGTEVFYSQYQKYYQG